MALGGAPLWNRVFRGGRRLRGARRNRRDAAAAVLSLPVPESAGDGGRTLPARLAIALAFAALAIRLLRLSHFSYWLDEILESFTIHDSWKGMWRGLFQAGIHPPLDYAIRKILDGLHPSEAAARLPGVLWGTLTVACAAILLARRVGRPAGVVIGVVLAVSPFHVRYSQEARSYALGMLLVLASLLLLDRFLEQPSPSRLASLYLASLAAAYTLYVAALALLIAGSGLVLEDAFSSDFGRRRNARRFLAWSPLFAAALWIGFLPWWPALLTELRSAPTGAAPPWSLARISRYLSYFGFGHADLQPLGWPGALFAAGCLTGLVIAWKTRGARFLLVWSVLGIGIFEAVEHRHPVYDSIFHYTPAGLSLPLLYSIAIAALLGRRPTRTIGAGLLLLSVLFAAISLREYFRSGRPDWRPLAAYLRATPTEDRIVTDTDYTQLCVAYYVAGPDWFLALRRHASPRRIDSLHGRPAALDALREPGGRAWLVRMAVSPAGITSESSAGEIAFPAAEGGGAFVRRLDPPR